MHLTCPHCGFTMDVSLRGKPSAMVVCVCSRCKAPLMCYEGEVYELDRDEFQNLRRKLTPVLDALLSKAQEGASARMVEAVPKEAAPVESASLGAISKSDVEDLTIDLETSQDVSDFINRI
ncbi:MAG: hypothetical protein WCS54_05530 [Fibrobacteraceae bacterium]|jgi:hypothetical protein